MALASTAKIVQKKINLIFLQCDNDKFALKLLLSITTFISGNKTGVQEVQNVLIYNK